MKTNAWQLLWWYDSVQKCQRLMAVGLDEITQPNNGVVGWGRKPKWHYKIGCHLDPAGIWCTQPF